ncbi:MAG: hypothetical protein WDN48_06915, partial [Pseudolabrys sp.]
RILPKDYRVLLLAALLHSFTGRSCETTPYLASLDLPPGAALFLPRATNRWRASFRLMLP